MMVQKKKKSNIFLSQQHGGPDLVMIIDVNGRFSRLYVIIKNE